MNKKGILDENKMRTVLDALYDKTLVGIPKVGKSVDELAEDYLKKWKTPEAAANSMVNYQTAKCGISGFLTGIGGLITLPVAIPANVSSVLYFQLRMVATIAKLGGHDIRSDQVQTFVYACLTGSSMADVLKRTGIKISEKVTENMIKKIPGAVLAKINKAVGFRLVTKFGTTGAINLVKVIPIAGGVAGGVADVATTKIIAINAIKLFIDGKLTDQDLEEEIIDIDYDDVA